MATLHARLLVLTVTEFGDWHRVRLGTGAVLPSEQVTPGWQQWEGWESLPALPG